ncbi:chitobiase/beta-hexosaminidase C-terminal domain-containing protein [Treponema sp. OMZ 840]|uniref:chitobiase/beta-hexosaminidase C-terminal domain-containing protein n=1 Tax=Treponema sp. OMZ 840 TaxID=244313 RepID=UPI003D8DA729
MNHSPFFRLRFFVYSFFLNAFFFIPVSAQSGIRILNPAAGVWANYQSLVLDLPEGTEAFYSFNGEDPSVSGLAYDGPVVLNIAGNVQLSVATIDRNGKRSFSKINYTVVLKETPAYIEAAHTFSSAASGLSTVNGTGTLNGIHPFIRIDSSSYLDIPQEISYTLGDTGVPFSGKRLALSSPTVFERYVPLIVYDGEIPYRYVLHTGGDGGSLAAETAETGDTVFDASVPVHFDLKGLPKFPAVNTTVELSFGNEDFLFCVKTKDGRILYSPVFTVEALEGDAFGFSQDIDVLYKGVKYGSVRPSFIIDKIPPRQPVFVASESDFYARKNVNLDIQGGALIYYYIPPPIQSQKGFFRSDIETLDKSVTPVNPADFKRFDGEILTLPSSRTEALLYTVYAYSLDAAGNKSETVRFQTVVDTVNYYVSDRLLPDRSTEKADGSPDKPFDTFLSLYGAVQKSDAPFIRCLADGTFSGIQSLLIERDTEICGNGKTRLQFEKGASLIVRNAFFSLKDCTLEQNYGGISDVFQNHLISAECAVLSFSGSELICKDPNTASCLNLSASSADMEKCGITVEASVYADAVSAEQSTVNLHNVRSLIIAQTGIGLKSVQSSISIKDSSFRLSGKLVRALEFVDSNFTLDNNNFISEKNMKGIAAVWDNISSGMSDYGITADEKKVSEENTYSGFSSLY